MSLALQFLPLYLLLPAHGIAESRYPFPLWNMHQRDPEILDLTLSLVRVWNGSGLSPHGPEIDNSRRLEKLFALITKRLVDIRVVQNAEFKPGFCNELRMCVLTMVLAEILHGVVYNTDYTLNTSYQISEITGNGKYLSMPLNKTFKDISQWPRREKVP